MTPEREAQMRGEFERHWESRGLQFGTGALTNAFKEVALDSFLACARALEPMVRDGERLQAYCMTRNPENDALLQIELRILNGEIPTMDEWRTAIDAAVGAALEDGNATE